MPGSSTNGYISAMADVRNAADSGLVELDIIFQAGSTLQLELEGMVVGPGHNRAGEFAARNTCMGSLGHA